MSNPVAADLPQTLRNITEKVDWAQRSINRISESIRQKDALAVQDHFWSFLHASQLLWFYVGRYFSSIGAPAGSAQAFVQNWKANALDSDEQTIWDAINDLRTWDVHAEPVTTELKPETRILVKDGKILISVGKILVRTTVQYLVCVDSQEAQAQEVAGRWIRLARKLTECLRQNPPQ